MANAQPTYDPARSITGLWKGAIARLGYVLKDPTGYGPSNPIVLAEVAKKFQDSLDDCEIQIFDAKWYLEHQLAQNKERREARSREEGANLAKRKHDEITDVMDIGENDEGEQNAKRVKIEDARGDTSPITQSQPQPDAEKVQTQTPILPLSNAIPNTNEQSDLRTPENPQPASQIEKPAPPVLAPANPPESQRPESQRNVTIEDFTKPTPQESPTPTNDEDFNFESMFGEPTVETNEDATNDLAFDLNLEPSDPMQQTEIPAQAPEQPTQASAPDHSSPALLPGLESYANQAGDGDIFNVENKAVADAEAAANDFQLPDLTENDFDAFFNENEFDYQAGINQGGGGGGGGGGGANAAANFSGDINLGDLDLENMDFANEDIFN